MSTEKKVLIGILIVTIIGVAAWMFWELKPRFGTKIEDLGRGHVPIGTPVAYNSNPPTSGPHYEEWVRKGVYDRPQEDRHLVHSLEHGYIIMSYNCAFKPVGWIKEIFAQEATDAGQIQLKNATEDASSSAMMTPDFESDSCKSLVNDLRSIYGAKGTTKLIVVPRPQLDSKVAVTAWGYLMKFNEFNREQIEKFINSNINQGPERTMEP